MSFQAVQQVLDRALADHAFLLQVFQDPERALAGYDLSREELAAIRALRPGQSAALDALLDSREGRPVLLA